MKTLKDAIANNQLDEFIKEHAKDDAGDAEKLDATLE